MGGVLTALAGVLPSAPSGTNFSDDFNRADNTDLNAAGIGGYTELTPGGWQIFNNHLINATGGFSWTGVVNDGHPTDTVNQYGKLTISVFDASVNTGGFIFRFTDASSPFYVVWVDDNANEIRWRHWTAVGGTVSTVGSTAFSPSFPYTLGATINGTGNSTEVKIWIDPTGLPPGWGAPDFTLTDNPASPVDTGMITGIACEGNSVAQVDDWFWGDAP